MEILLRLVFRKEKTSQLHRIFIYIFYANPGVGNLFMLEGRINLAVIK
jgi:hypothetical protein